MAKKTYQPRYRKPSIQSAIEHFGLKGVHPECESVPEIGSREFDILVESIERNGLEIPVWVNHDGILLDGRSRLRACFLLDIDLSDDKIEATELSANLIADANLETRHLTRDQRTMRAIKLLEDERKEAAKRRRNGAERGRKNRRNPLGTSDVPSRRAPRALDIAAKKAGVPRDDLAAAEKLQKSNPKVAGHVLDGKCTLDEGCEAVQIYKRAKRRRKKKIFRKSYGSYLDYATTFSDHGTTISDPDDGIRRVRCGKVIVFRHSECNHQVFAYRRKKYWIVRATNRSNRIPCKTWQRAEKLAVHWMMQQWKDANSPDARPKSQKKKRKGRKRVGMVRVE